MGGFDTHGHGFLACDFPFYPRPRRWEEADGGGEEREAAARDTGGIAGAVRREVASRESEERGDGDDDRIRRSSDRATA